ncbi:LacI family DNA-binding transcriptional regulator [Cryobacterium serini]|uniref:LacI family DNA-binding transcriptional regulator n=1 Tax=Cryobacterium serini TaxID=1259201 RepID=A0A4R9BJP5_9MICO|nr:LacI family DNA-binding transcriptional regulator [Cryobacterium serini]TFD86011.1 LacI family DNA-binding transcriptional regulator [Cryobacterium serini]
MSAEPPKERAPSIRDVARLAGVSHQTVSRVLNDHPSIRESTKARILQVMEELQYRPNQAARALSKGRSRTIGVLTASSAQYGPARSVVAIEDAARRRGYFVDTANLNVADPAAIEDALEHLLDQAVEGLVIIAPQERVFDVLERLDAAVPCVSLQSTGKHDLRALAVNQILGARMATRHLIDLGHREIVHLAGPQDWNEAEARMRGFLLEIDDADLMTHPPILGDWTADFGYFAGRELLRSRDFSAVFAANDEMALGLLHALHDARLNVPGDVSVVGFNDVPVARHSWPPLTTVHQDFEAIGQRAFEALLSAIGTSDEIVASPIAPCLVVRGSTGPVPVSRLPLLKRY